MICLLANMKACRPVWMYLFNLLLRDDAVLPIIAYIKNCKYSKIASRVKFCINESRWKQCTLYKGP